MKNEKIISFCADNKIKWAFFDFFGTTVKRNCNSSEIKLFWAKQLSEKMDFLFSSDEIYKVRLSVEKKLWSASKSREIKYIDVINEIYKRLCLIYDAKLSITASQFLELSKESELFAETKSQELIEENVELMRTLHEKGIKIAVVSDFYLDKSFFNVFLEKHNINNFVDEIFVSCDYDESKASGKLYKAVLASLNENAQDCIMIGDNEKSDIINSKANGIVSFKVDFCEKDSKKLISKQLKRIYKMSYKGKLRYSNYAYSLYLACERLYTAVIKQQISELYFLSREGQLLKRLFDEYLIGKKNAEIKTNYLYVSRKATYPTTLKPLSEESFSSISGFEKFRISDLIDNIGIDYENNKKIFDGYDINEDIPDFFNSKIFQKLKQDSGFGELYDNTVKQNKTKLKKYFEQSGIDLSGGKVAFVDVGWRGTMQNNIHSLLSENTVIGFYVGINEVADADENSRKYGLLFSGVPYKSKDYNVFSYDHVFFERLLWADHGATEKYIDNDGKIEPILKEYESEKKNYERMKPVQEALFKKFKEISKLFALSPYSAQDFYNEFRSYHIKTIFTVNKQQLILQKQMIDNQMQNFGKITTAKESLDNTFSKKRILKKAFKRLNLLQNTEVVFRILQRYNAYLFIKIIYSIKKQRIFNDIKKGRQ